MAPADRAAKVKAKAAVGTADDAAPGGTNNAASPGTTEAAVTREPVNLARARAELLCDPGTFHAVRTAVGDGVIAGSGKVGGRAVYVWAQDVSFKGGSLGSARWRDDRAHDADGRARMGAGRRLPALRRGAPAGGRRRARGVRLDLPRAGALEGAADLGHRRPVRGRRRVLAGARRPRDDGRSRVADVPHGAEDHRARHARGRDGGGARRSEGPREDRRVASRRGRRRRRRRPRAQRPRPPSRQGRRRAAAGAAVRAAGGRPGAPRADATSARSTTCGTSSASSSTAASCSSSRRCGRATWSSASRAWKDGRSA